MNIRPTPVEKLIHRIEEHVEEWRKQETDRQLAIEADMDEWWAEAAERERLLVETVSREEEERYTVEEATKERKIAFVVHTQGAGDALEEFAGERARLVRIVSGKRDYEGISGFKGSWLVFEDSEDVRGGGSE